MGLLAGEIGLSGIELVERGAERVGSEPPERRTALIRVPHKSILTPDPKSSAPTRLLVQFRPLLKLWKVVSPTD
jgi:hypothetical protein